MARRGRLDAELVRRGLARSRADAVSLIAEGRVRVGGWPATKASTSVSGDDPIVVDNDNEDRWVSRGAHKLLGALDALDVVVDGLRCLDAGASTGGFTQVLLSRGAKSVAAVDVGYGQLAWPLRTDERVRVIERRNVRDLKPDEIGGPVDLTVADLSFISLRTVLPALAECTATEGSLLLMCKPQFEIGRGAALQHGVVRDPESRVAAVVGVGAAAATLGLGSVAIVASVLPGPAGNVEYFLLLRRAPNGHEWLDPERLERAAVSAVAIGPT